MAAVGGNAKAERDFLSGAGSFLLFSLSFKSDARYTRASAAAPFNFTDTSFETPGSCIVTP